MDFAIQKPFSNFVMQTTKVMTKIKEIIINSPKYGQKIILIDSEDYELVSSRVWHLSKAENTFYAITNKHKALNLPQQKMHRLIMHLNNPKELIDHIDGNGLNNCKSNLRKCNTFQNTKNSKKKRKNATSVYKGVYRHKCGKYATEIKLNYKKIHIGLFDNEIDAAKAYNQAALKYHGEFANLNLIPCVV